MPDGFPEKAAAEMYYVKDGFIRPPHYIDWQFICSEWHRLEGR